MTDTDCQDKTHPNYDYLECEFVKPWHITLSIVLFTFTILVAIFVLLTTIIIYNYSYFNSIRFRCPKSIIIWGILTEIYLISRILYCGLILKWWTYSIPLDIFTYSIRGLGLNGGIMIYIIRAWMYYVTYKYDQDMLNNHISTNKSWLFSNPKYKNTIANEKWLLSIGMIILCILTAILAICRRFDIEFFSNIYYGISFILSIFILILVFKFAHDQLGIRIEYVAFFIVYIFGMIGTVLISSTLADTDKRVLSWLGGLILLAAGNAFTFYFPFIRGGILKLIRNKNFCITEEQKYENHKELAWILSNKRTYEAFRTFLASIFCVENIDFFVAVAHYRSAHKQLELQKLEQQKNAESKPTRPTHKATASLVLEKVFTVKKILKGKRSSTIAMVKNKKPTDAIKALPHSLPNPDEYKRAISDSETPNPPNMPRNNSASTQNGEDGATEYDQDVDEDDGMIEKKGRHPIKVSLDIPADKITKVMKSSVDMLKDFKRQKNADDMIQHLVIDQDGKKRIDPKSLDIGYIEYNEELSGLDINLWPRWIYDHYIGSQASVAINIPYEMRLNIERCFDDKSKTVVNTPPTPTSEKGLKEKQDVIMFDDAQHEVWRLMVNDSLGHFKRTDTYKQLKSFVQTVSPDVEAKPKLGFNGYSTDKSESDGERFVV